MQIIHDRSYIGQTSREFISRGYACESIYSLRFSFAYTEAQQAENRAYADQVGFDSDEWNTRVSRAALLKSGHMEPVAALLAKNLKVYQFDKNEDIPYRSDWDLFFWCNDLSQTVRGGLSGRDYSYFTMTFNENHGPDRRQRIYSRVMRILNQFVDDPNLEIAVQYVAIMDDIKLQRDAEIAAPKLGGRTCEHRGMEGRLEWSGERLYFRKKRSRTYIYRLTDAEILALSWKLSA